MSTTWIAAVLMLACACLAGTIPDRHRVFSLAAGSGWAGLGFGILAASAATAGWVILDAISAITLLLTGFVGAIVLSYSRRYLRADADPRSYVVKTLLLLGAVMLFAGARDMVTLAVGWIASGWLLAGLIGHMGGWRDARSARRRAMLTFVIGDVALIAGLTALAMEKGGISLDRLGGPPSTTTTLAALLIVISASVRCALPPFQRWLGRSMTAPTPVSALMHAGFVNGGGVLLIRFAPVLEAAPLARIVTIAVGMIAALIGTAIMMVRPDIKRSLAGSTSAQMGFMLMTCGLGAYAAALWHLVAHGLFKAWLFLRSGSAIGIGERSAVLHPATVAGIGVVMVAACLALGAIGSVPVQTVPLMLALATTLVTLSKLASEPTVAGPAVVLLAAYAGALTAFDHLLAHPFGPAIGGAILPAMIVAVFMIAWLAQALALAGRIRPPVALYARLLNA